MFPQAAIKPHTLHRNEAHRIVNRAVQKCTCAGASLRNRKRLPLCCINLDTATDPCCGSGHILAYLFDVLVQIYESYGYTTREAVESIVKNNLYGLDIDDRAAQLAYFAVMMKARQYDRRFFSRQIQPNVYAIRESNDVDKYALDYFCNGDAKLKAAMDSIVKEMQDAKEYGSILNITPVDFAALYARFDEVRDDISISKETVLNDLLPLVRVAEILAQKYDVVVTNPPYMGSGGMGVKLTDFVKKNYPDSKSDMSTVCMEKTLSMCRKNGFMTMINIPVWMFLASYENLRNALLRDNTIINMIHPGRGIFGSDFGTTTFVFRKSNSCGYVGCYHRLFDTQGEVKSNEEREKAFLERKGQYYTDQLNFSKIPGTPVAYWVSDTLMEAFAKGIFVGDICEPRVGMATANNDRFIRLWYEVSMNKIGLGMKNREEAVSSKKKWFPFSKGGEFRKWYGNNDYVVNWENDGIEIRNFKDEKTGRIRSHNYNLDYIFQSAITWTVISSATTSFRFCPEGFLYSNSGYGMFFLHKSDIPVTLGFLNTSVVMSILSVLSPTIGFESGYLRKIPYLSTPDEVTAVVNECVSISKADWDDFESSWDFKNHPLIRLKDSMKLTATDGDSKMVSYFLQGIYHAWENECEERFNQLKANEEELNRIFIDIYGLQDELTPEVEDKDVTVRKADLQRDIRSLISYAVGCMFGRYSLDTDGLAFAGGDWDDSKYITYPADKDNIIPICDDEYFDDDMVGRFVKFIETVYGSDTLEENLKFIADVLGGKGQPREVIRNYFLNDFYADHCKIYQKRPIYWLLDSGKKNGFKALIYMHRYQPDTIARIRTDYVHEQQSRYRTAIADMENRIANASTSERVKLNKAMNRLKDQDTELRTYEEKIHHLADQMIAIDLDDGVKVNYAKFQDVLAKIK